MSGNTIGQKQVLDSVKTSFTFSTSTPVDFGTLNAGDQILSSEIVIDTVFDDVGALLALGLVSAPGSILATNQVDPQTVGTYISSENILIGGSDQIRLQITPGVSTQGSGRVVIVIRRA